MRKVERSELLDLAAYEKVRDDFRNRIIERKRNRRVQLGPHMSLVFENHDTVLLQINEMLRTERITDERAIEHELSTYNEMIPEPNTLCGTLFIEYDDAATRKDMLMRFASLRQHVRLRLGDAESIARFSVHHGEELDRLPAVNYLTFALAPFAATQLADASCRAALVVTHPDYEVALPLSPATRAELAADLSS